jgi:hypothetical protein
MSNRLRLLAIGTAILGMLAGCVSPGPSRNGTGDLARRLSALGPEVDPAEALLAAETACSYSLALANQYRAVRPPFVHNILVNLGYRQRGLCFHWAEDISAELERLELRTLVIHRGVARLGKRGEHSSVVLTAPGQAFEEGVVLDGWRRSGRLYWQTVRDDKYKWQRVRVVEDDGQSPGADSEKTAG